MEDKLQYHSKLVGVTFEGRQDIIGMLKGDEQIRTRREPENEYDKNAVAVDVLIAEVWQPIGYIAKDKNKDICESMDAGNDINISIASITGGNGKSFGVNISLEYDKAISKAPQAVEKLKMSTNPSFELDTPQRRLEAAVELFIAETSNIRTEKYTSRLLGKSIKLNIVNGHKRLDGYLSGSKFPDKFYAEFNEDDILQKIVDKYFKEKERERAKKSILSMWDLNREASTGYGTAIHAALENYDTYQLLGEKIKKVEVLKTKTKTGPNKSLSRNPFLKKIVEDFHEKFGGNYVRFSEQFIWHEEKKLCGSIDRLKIIDADKKIVRIQDFKTDGDIHEKKYQLVDSPFYSLTQGTKPELGKELLDSHWLQLSFYAYILKQYGYIVEGLDIYWLNPNKLVTGENAWEEFSHEVINIENVL